MLAGTDGGATTPREPVDELEDAPALPGAEPDEDFVDDLDDEPVIPVVVAPDDVAQ